MPEKAAFCYTFREKCGLTIISGGGNQFSLGQARAVALDHYNHTPLWIEAAWQNADGTLYAWYAYESGQACDSKLTVPRIGALVSHDGGLSFTDLGIIIESGDPPDCWSYPAKILDNAGWYPQILGLEPEGTDKLAGQSARLYVGGHSEWKMVFTK